MYHIREYSSTIFERSDRLPKSTPTQYQLFHWVSHNSGLCGMLDVVVPDLWAMRCKARPLGITPMGWP